MFVRELQIGLVHLARGKRLLKRFIDNALT